MVDGTRLLRKFLKETGRRQAEIVAALDVSRPTVSEWVGGSRVPGRDRRVQLEMWSGGAIPAASWETKEQRLERERQEGIASRLAADAPEPVAVAKAAS